MEYFPVAFTFVSALIALFGSTWNKDAQGFRKVTGVGWAAVVLIALSTYYSAFSVYVVKSDKATIQSIINNDISRALDELEDPFRTLYMDINGGIYLKNLELTDLLDKVSIAKMQRTCFLERPRHITTIPDTGPWGDMFAARIASGVARLDSVVSSYGSHISADVLEAIHRVREHNFSRYARFSEGYFAMGAEYTTREPKCLVGHVEGTFKSYIEGLIHLREAITDRGLT